MPWSARINLILTLLAFAVPWTWNRWVKTRDWVPVSMPISLASGHIKTPEFTINQNANYEIAILLRESTDRDDVACMLGLAYVDCSGKAPVFNASWILSREGRVVAKGDSKTNRTISGNPWRGWDSKEVARGFGEFSLQGGQRYSLDVEILNDDSRLDVTNPRLQISADTDPYFRYRSLTARLIFHSALLLFFELILLVRLIVLRLRHEEVNPRPAITSPGKHSIELQLDGDRVPLTGSSQYF